MWDATTFTHNSEQFEWQGPAQKFFEQVAKTAGQELRLKRLLQRGRDGTLIQSWASFESVRPKNQRGNELRAGGSNPSADFRGQRRGNQTQRSTTDAEVRLAKQSPSVRAQLCYSGHVLMKNRQGLCLDIRVAQVDG